MKFLRVSAILCIGLFCFLTSPTQQLSSGIPLVLANENEKVLMKGKYLELAGGYRIPPIIIDGQNIRWSSGQMDKLPGSNKWLISHPKSAVIELIEPGDLGTGDPSTWPELIEGRSAPVFTDIQKISAGGVFWLDEDRLLTSGRKNYRSGFEPKWMAEVNLADGSEVHYEITAQSNDNNENFHVLQSLAGGFMRITDPEWSARVAKGNNFLLGRGGYDVLGSPLGPALGSWNIGDPHADFVLDFPHEAAVARRDIYYTYPTIDPNSYTKARLPMWKYPENGEGYWQAGDVGGSAFINHPQVKGVVSTHNHGRGVHDYRAQGDSGSGKYFLVLDPQVFYNPETGGGDRGNHKQEVLNAQYPKGVFARVGHVFDPDHLEQVAQGSRDPWDVPSTRFEWPAAGITWQEQGKGGHTKLGAVYWDNDRQLLWVVIVSPEVILAAYEIIVDDSRPEEPLKLPDKLDLIIGNESQPLPGSLLEIRSFHPSLISRMNTSKSQTFSIEVHARDEQAVNYVWRLNGTQVSSSQSFDFFGQDYVKGSWNLSVTADDGNSTVTKSWKYKLRTPKRQDVNDDDQVDREDVRVVATHIIQNRAYRATYDMNDDQKINLFDLIPLIQEFGTY